MTLILFYWTIVCVKSRGNSTRKNLYDNSNGYSYVWYFGGKGRKRLASTVDDCGRRDCWKPAKIPNYGAEPDRSVLSAERLDSGEIGRNEKNALQNNRFRRGESGENEHLSRGK